MKISHWEIFTNNSIGALLQDIDWHIVLWIFIMYKWSSQWKTNCILWLDTRCFHIARWAHTVSISLSLCIFKGINMIFLATITINLAWFYLVIYTDILFTSHMLSPYIFSYTICHYIHKGLAYGWSQTVFQRWKVFCLAAGVLLYIVWSPCVTFSQCKSKQEICFTSCDVIVRYPWWDNASAFIPYL